MYRTQPAHRMHVGERLEELNVEESQESPLVGGLGQQDILFEGVLCRYGLRWPVRNYLAVVDSPSQLVETHAIAAEAAFECRQIQPSEVGYGLYVEGFQRFLRDLSHSG